MRRKSMGDDLRVTDELTADPICAAATIEAHAALVLVTPTDTVGEHIGVQHEGEWSATHLFESLLTGYRGWRWAVTVNRVPDADQVTVAETVLLPGPQSILAPAWVPWSDRIQSDDLAPGDVLPTEEGDPRLVPGYTGADQDGEDDDQLRPLWWELGLGRVQVLSPEGRLQAAHRWRRGSGGPKNEMARQAPACCSTCGFLLPLAGRMGQEFGVCANEKSPADGQVVTMDHGCGAHSEAVESGPTGEQPAGLVLDDEHEVIEEMSPPAPEVDQP